MLLLLMACTRGGDTDSSTDDSNPGETGETGDTEPLFAGDDFAVYDGTMRVFFNIEQQRFKGCNGLEWVNMSRGAGVPGEPGDKELAEVGGAFEWSDGTHSGSCREYLRDPAYFGGGDGSYRITDGENNFVSLDRVR